MFQVTITDFNLLCNLNLSKIGFLGWKGLVWGTCMFDSLLADAWQDITKYQEKVEYWKIVLKYFEDPKILWEGEEYIVALHGFIIDR